MSEPKISSLITSSAAALKTIQNASDQKILQIESGDDLNGLLDPIFNPLIRARTFKELDELKSGFLQEGGKELEEVEEITVIPTEQIEEAASRFARNNPEFSKKTLLILRERMNAKDTPEEVLAKVNEVYPDPALADEALDFLIEMATPQMRFIFKKAKELFNSSFEREIKAGRNMGMQAREFSTAGLGSPTSLRDLYRDITGMPRDPLILFNELAEKFRYEQLKLAIHFLLHSLGSDLRAKGPSIPREELKRLIDETRSLQGILGVFRFFQSRVKLMERQFNSFGLLFPQRIDFEVLAKTLIRLLAERYVNPEKILQLARALGIDQECAAQIIIFTQMRDAIKQISPRYFRNQQHYDELWKSFLDALDSLEDKIDEDEEEEEGKK